MLRARVDRPRCIGAGNCITIAPTAFDWHRGDFGKAGVVDATSVDEEKLREAALACPTQAIVLEEVAELLPWQLRGRAPTQRVQRTFMFTDIVGSTRLAETLGDDAWERLLRRHDELVRGLIAGGGGQVVNSTGDGFFAAFETARSAVDTAIAVQEALRDERESAASELSVRIGLHTADATQRGADYSGIGVHVAARIGALAGAGEIVASAATLDQAGDVAISGTRSEPVRGVTTPVEVATIAWH